MKITERLKIWWLFRSYDLKKYHQWFTDPIYYFFKPQQGWLIKHLRKTWMDKDELIETCLFQSLVHWVELEKSDHDIDWGEELKSGHVSQEYINKQLGIERQVNECYQWIKFDKPKMEAEMNSAWPEDYPFFGEGTKDPERHAYLKSQSSKYVAKYVKLENQILKKDTQIMKKIIDLRGYLWT